MRYKYLTKTAELGVGDYAVAGGIATGGAALGALSQGMVSMHPWLKRESEMKNVVDEARRFNKYLTDLSHKGQQPLAHAQSFARARKLKDNKHRTKLLRWHTKGTAVDNLQLNKRVARARLSLNRIVALKEQAMMRGLKRGGAIGAAIGIPLAGAYLYNRNKD